MIEPGQEITLNYSNDKVTCIERKRIRSGKIMTILYTMQTQSGQTFTATQEQVEDYINRKIWIT